MQRRRRKWVLLFSGVLLIILILVAAFVIILLTGGSANITITPGPFITPTSVVSVSTPSIGVVTTPAETPKTLPVPTTTPLPEQTFKEFIETQWPTSMSTASSSRVKISYIRTLDQSLTPVIEIVGQRVAVATPLSVAGTPGATINQAFPNEDGFLTATLNSAAFDIKQTTLPTYSLEQPTIVWQWDITPKNSQTTGNQLLDIEIDATWKAKGSDTVIRNRQVWVATLSTEIYSGLINSVQVTAFSMLGGVALVGIGGSWLFKKYRGRRSVKTTSFSLLAGKERRYAELVELINKQYNLRIELNNLISVTRDPVEYARLEGELERVKLNISKFEAELEKLKP